MRRNSRISKTLFKVCAAPLFFLGLVVAAHADNQPNPYKFPVAKGADIPIAEGYWATSQDSCAKLELTEQKRPHIGFKGMPIANGDSFPAHTFQYLGPRLGNWPDGLCYVLEIRRETNSRFLVSGYCGSEPSSRNRREDQFSGAVVVHGERHISIAARGVGPTGDYYFCKSVLNRK